ncbi:MAG: penicillin-binding protein 1A, partial [Alphaproteobacteria bacterium]
MFCAFWGLICAVGLYIYAYATYGKDLPTVDFMKDYSPPTVSRFHAADGQLIDEHATERRLFIPVEAIPRHVLGAFLSAEDKDFYSHSGIDYISLGGAVLNNIKRYQAGRRLVGASTITQQVAKNFLTAGQRSVERKIREAFIAWRLEAEFTKDEILELYLNEVEFGRRSFGLASASLTYFNKSVKDLTVEEAAYLAATLKGPNNYDPETKAEAAKERRDWVIGQMERNGYITDIEALVAKADPVKPNWGYRTNQISASYFSEEVLRQLNQDYGKQLVLEEGLSVRSTLDPQVQDMAERALRKGLNAYDRRHGWRGPLGTIDLSAVDWNVQLVEFEKTPGLTNWKVALVYEVSNQEAKIAFPDETGGFIKLEDLKWARPWLSDQKLGPSVRRAADVLSPGDVVAVTRKSARTATWTLEQIPDLQGAVVVMNPHNGRVQAIVGGYDYEISQFNRATQALRQPGSTFKPFVYLAALDKGKTPESKVLDSPVVVRMDNGEIYKPRNSDGRFLGQQPLRIGLEKSRNLMTLRLAQEIGMDEIVN